MFSLHSFLQIDEIDDRSLEALELYRVAEDAIDYREDVNDFVTFIQDSVCSINLLLNSCSSTVPLPVVGLLWSEQCL